MAEEFDAVVIGSGPNGLAAAVVLAQAGKSVCVLEARSSIGGGTRTVELTLPGFLHDQCSAVHPMGVLSPFLSRLPLAEHGLEWRFPTHSVAHPLDGGRVALLSDSLAETALGLTVDDGAWRRLFAPFLRNPEMLLKSLLGPPFRIPRRPFTMARFGLLGLCSARGLARSKFEGEEARALLAGCAAHSILPLTHKLTAAVGLIFALSAHMRSWPVAAGGSSAITAALASLLRRLGGTIRCDQMITAMAELPSSRVVLFDTSPEQLASIASDELPPSYVRKLLRYRYGPAVFKLDWALDGPIPWTNPATSQASTVHVGGTLDEITASEAAMWKGNISERPFLILCQQSQFDDSRSPEGKHTGYAYCHVPSRCTEDMTGRIEQQIERFAPGFRDLILARHATSPSAFQTLNPNLIGGAITGGVSDFRQFFARPVLRLNPYRTPNRRIFLCSASTPPGGGVHGMCGYFAARAALRRF